MANIFPTTLNDWDDGETIESGWADALEAKIGIDNSAVATSLDYLIKNISSKLGKIASLAVTNSNIIVGDGTNWVVESGATARTSLGLGTGDSPTFAGATLSGTAAKLAIKNTTTGNSELQLYDTTDGGWTLFSNDGILRLSVLNTSGVWQSNQISISAAGVISAAGSYQVDDVQVVGNRVIDARCDDVINSGDATTDGVIDSLRDAMIAHGLIAAA